jgi:tRNA threonylcarbamoyladenosine biosynthesis protein TsaE
MAMAESYVFLSESEEETRMLARKMAALLKPGDVLALEGDLGAGKTAFAKGVAEGLGIRDAVDSPTFTIVKEYDGRLPFYHMDVYRIESADEELGLEEYFYGDGICLVEWASRVASHLPDEAVWIRLTAEEDGRRRIEIELSHARAVRLCKELTEQ